MQRHTSPTSPNVANNSSKPGWFSTGQSAGEVHQGRARARAGVLSEFWPWRALRITEPF